MANKNKKINVTKKNVTKMGMITKRVYYTSKNKMRGIGASEQL